MYLADLHTQKSAPWAPGENFETLPKVEELAPPSRGDAQYPESHRQARQLEGVC